MNKKNRNFGRVDESGNIEYAPLPLVVDGVNVWTNIAETYLKEGFYPIELTESPVKEGFFFTPYWEIENEKCVQKWAEHAKIEPEEVTTGGEEVPT